MRGGLTNNEAHNNLSWFRPLLEGNSPTSSSLILKMNKYYKGWAESSTSSHGERKNGEAHFYQGVLIQHQSFYGNYACTFGRVAMSDGDGIDPSTWVPIARGAWVPAVLSYHARCLIMLPFTCPVLSAFPSAAIPWVRLLGAWVRRGFVVGRWVMKSYQSAPIVTR
jgi:hypothetical protein